MTIQVAPWLLPYLARPKVAKKRPLARVLIGLRKEKGWTQKQLAAKLEGWQSMVSRVEAGSAPSLSYITAFAEALELDSTQVVDLMALAGNDTALLYRGEDEIEAEVAAARRWLGESCHFLHDQTGTGYWVAGFAVREEDCEILVVYTRGLSDGGQPIFWTRPLDEFKARFVAAPLEQSQPTKRR